MCIMFVLIWLEKMTNWFFCIGVPKYTVMGLNSFISDGDAVRNKLKCCPSSVDLKIKGFLNILAYYVKQCAKK